MKRLIKVINKETADELELMGYKHMVELVDDKEVYVFVETDALFKLLNDKKKFSKRHWYVDNIMRF